MHIDELDFTLEDFPVGAYNYDAYGLCCVFGFGICGAYCSFHRGR